MNDRNRHYRDTTSLQLYNMLQGKNCSRTAFIDLAVSVAVASQRKTSDRSVEVSELTMATTAMLCQSLVPPTAGEKELFSFITANFLFFFSLQGVSIFQTGRPYPLSETSST